MSINPKQKKFYITTSIAYVNAPPHIGFALETIQADALARYHRLKGEDVFLLSGTDENSEKINQSALKNKKDPVKMMDEYAERFKQLLKILNISNSDFIRTTDSKRHWPAAQEIWRRAEKNGDIYKKKYGGYYCIGCEAFKTEKDLVDGKCPLHNAAPEWREEENYFFRWSNHQKFLEDYYEKNPDFVVPRFRYNEMREFLKKGLEDISISRVKEKIPWGIPVPGDNTQVMYVWFDALTNYLSGLDFPSDNAKYGRYWPADVHLVGKDIDRWHSLLWPAMLHSSGLPLPKHIYVHGFITSKGQKMSKTIGNVIDPFDTVKKYPNIDALRYYLLKEIPTSEDGDFTFERFEEVYQADLANGLGNFTARTLTMAEKYCNGNIPETKNDPEKHPLRVGENIYNWKKAWQDMEDSLNAFRINEAVASIWKFIAEADKYIDENKPWVLAKNGKTDELNWVLYGLLDGIHQVAWQIYPFMPETSLKIAESLDIKGLLKEKPDYKDSWVNIKPGTKIKKGGILFPRIDMK